MEYIYFDECGYTGEDLLNVDQPYFVLSSMHLPEADAVLLRDEFFKGVRSDELKFASLKRKTSRQEMVLNFLEYLKANEQLYNICVVNKRFALVCKTVDFVIETAMSRLGQDIYKDGFAVALANMLWFTIPEIYGKEKFEQFLSSFQILCREQSQEAFEAFFSEIPTIRSPGVDLFELFDLAKKLITIDDLTTANVDILDVAFPEFLVLMQIWRGKLAGEITIVHDESKNIQSIEKIWKQLLNPNLPQLNYVDSNITIKYPLLVEAEFRSSHNNPGLQLADVVAGAFNKQMIWLDKKDKEKDGFGSKIVEIFEDTPIAHTILPSSDITPRGLQKEAYDGKKILDYFVSNIKINP